MVRKLLLPALAGALLAGCMTSGYQYRGGNGDYYYGQPSTQYRYYGAPYGSYGYPGGWGGSIGYGYYSHGYYPYGYSPYGYYGYGGGYPYYRYPYRPPVVIVQPGPGGGSGDVDNNGAGNNGAGNNGTDTGTDSIHNDRPRPPWRDLRNLDGRDTPPRSAIFEPGAGGLRETVTRPVKPPRVAPMPMPPATPRASTGGRSVPVTGARVRPGTAERDGRRKQVP